MKKSDTGDDEPEDMDAPVTKANPTVSAKITTKDFYSPTILSDYDGEVFQHENASLRQLDFRNVNNELIHPDRWYPKLRRGTLVMARATLHAFNWENRCVSCRIHNYHRLG